MTLGTRSLVRPVHNSGHLVAYSSKTMSEERQSLITAKAEFTKANLEQLPINDVCPSMFTMTFTDNDEAKTEVDGSSHEVAEEKEYSSGAANVTIGGNTPAESNVHGKVVKALSGNKILSPSDTKLEIYVVRPDNSFVSGSNPNYLEIHFPDLLPFGRGGTGETRRVEISHKAL
ncbi:hypothetical protein OUZ56_032929 [Daphnia magna]|uniref:Uncharacterized protein n=1 Tax=Daphnia magna TaxID=35525 RepID=A0ABQ9ZXI2_9CRUS|nr:hypothetical protein OUZ56_032929 [Daphnia magna]